jgi:hypothetical protein
MEESMIHRYEIAQSLPRDFIHVVNGVWDTKTIHIDGELVTVANLATTSFTQCGNNVTVLQGQKSSYGV